MIKSFQHAGLEEFFLTSNKKGIRPEHAPKLKRQLTALNKATSPESLLALGAWKMHPLKGNRLEFWAFWVSGNWRMIFKFEDEDVILVDYLDYHE